MPTRPPGWASPSVTRRTSPCASCSTSSATSRIPIPRCNPYAVFGNTNDIEERIYDNMENVFVRDLLPVDERFDMNMHILSFAPGGCHPFVETHVQEHGAYLYEGEGLYLLNDDWVPVKAEDFIWMGAYCKQCCYGVGLTRLSYIYSKDCHRDAEI